MTVHNAEITSTFLGIEDHGVMTFVLHLRWGGMGIGYGTYCLDRGSRGQKIGDGHAYQAIRYMLETVGVQQWESLKGKLCRIDFDDGPGCSGRVLRIGHILHDTWFDLDSYMKERRE